MMKSSRWALLLAVGTVGAGVVAGAIARFSATGLAGRKGAALEWAPASTSLVGHLDVRALSKSPLAETWSEAVKGQGVTTAEEIREATGIDLWKDVDAITVSITERTEDDNRNRWGLSVDGAFDAEAAAKKLVTARKDVAVEDYQGAKIYRLSAASRDSADVAMAVVGPSTALFGEPSYLREMLDVASGRKPSASGVVESWGFGGFAEDSFWVAGKPSKALRAVVGRGAEIPSLQAFALSGRLASEVSLRLRGKAADAASAQKLADLVRGFVALGRLQMGPTASNPELGTIAESVQVELAADRIDISLTVPYETIRKLSERRPKEAAGPAER
jgi:hypothetical protein